MSSTPISHIASWGYHSSILTAPSTEQAVPVNSTVTAVANIAHKVSVFLTTVGAFVVSFPGAMLVLLGITALYYGAQLYSRQTVCETAGLIVQKPEEFETLKLIPEMGDCEALPTDHSAETEQWRKKLLAAAEENIIISGNYCGGNSFLELLMDLEDQMKKKEKLKVVVISSPMFMTVPCIKKMEELRKNYPHRFSAIESGDILHVSPGVKKATNHTKCMVIDYGKYFILGGSGIKEQFTGTGTDQTKKAYLEANNHPPLRLEPDTAGGQGVIAQIMKGDLRDMDFVFHSQYGNNSVGRQVYKQMLLLCHRWEQYNKMVKGEKVPSRPAQLGAFDGQSSEISADDSVTMQLMKAPSPHWAFVRSTVPSFDQSPKKARDVAFKVLASGPEHKKSHYAEEVLNHINNAKKSIALNHMYFHPTDEIMNALIAAANRGIKITIITCGVHEGGPSSHHIFGPRNKANCAHLYNSVKKECRENIEVYEYNQGKNGLHKKAIIIDDDYVIAGSSNLGYKSLVTTNDHELNFFAKSKTFADKTRKVFQADIERSERRTDFSLNAKEHFMSFTHRKFAPLIG